MSTAPSLCAIHHLHHATQSRCAVDAPSSRHRPTTPHVNGKQLNDTLYPPPLPDGSDFTDIATVAVCSCPPRPHSSSFLPRLRDPPATSLAVPITAATAR